jgi:hypothetical protein
VKYTGKIDIIATALEPIIHGAGASGNTTLLRMQDWIYVDPRGRLVRTRVPFVSGNSVKHRLRVAAVQYALDAMGVEDGTLSKPEVDLLFSGGHLNKSGAAIDLTAARKLSELFPALSLCGYSAGNAMEESKIACHNLHVVCAENANRTPDDLRERPDVAPFLALSAGSLRVEEFGTRHDQATKRVGRRWLTAAAGEAVAARKADKLLGEGDAKPKSKKEKAPTAANDRGDSAQMIYDFHAIGAGAKLWGCVLFAELTDLERAALASAFHYAASGKLNGDLTMGVGAKNAVGYGSISVELRTSMRITAPQYATEALANATDSDAGRYAAHLRERKDEIVAAVREAVA